MDAAGSSIHLYTVQDRHHLRSHRLLVSNNEAIEAMVAAQPRTLRGLPHGRTAA